ncbi:MAG: hypothetical protein RL131_1071 [Bacteroidota bacterium]
MNLVKLFVSVLIFGLFPIYVFSQTRIKGFVLDESENPIGFVSISVGVNKTIAIANSNGHFDFTLPIGKTKIEFRHVGYETFVVDTLVQNTELSLKIILRPTSLTLNEIIIKPGGEDPAYEIIRNAISKRDFHRSRIEAYSCDNYLKGLIRTLNYPKTFMGQVVDFEDGDTSKQKIIFLSESISKINFKQPNDTRIDVISTQVSGQTNGLGLASPFLISFYENTVSLPRTFNPRGFVSPIADGALSFYNYKFLGTFIESGVLINRIQVTPKRKWEPLFRGYIQIVESSWDIHSVDLRLDKSAQLELAHEVRIQQQNGLFKSDYWLLTSQTIYLDIKIFGFDATGYFSSTYNNYELFEKADKKKFGNTLIRYDPESNKRTRTYWDSIRTIPLLHEEKLDYAKKDSLERLRESSSYLDSLDRIQNRVTYFGMFLNGQTFLRRSKKITFSYDPLLKSISYNTVEGLSVQASGTFRKSLNSNNSILLTPVLRYGVGNGHLNAFLSTEYRFGKKFTQQFSTAIGKRVFQFNNANPIPQIMNTVSTLSTGFNYMKLYEARFFQLGYNRNWGRGWRVNVSINYQDRWSLENLPLDRLWISESKLENISPNFPSEIAGKNILAHQAFSIQTDILFQPNTRYIELPDRVISRTSKSPRFKLQLSRGIAGILGSDVDYFKWRFSIQDEFNFKLAGTLKMNAGLSGFANATSVRLPDYNHISGNLTRKANPYVESFQVASFYSLSNRDRLYGFAHMEYSLNGLLTNKIPVIRNLNLRLVVGSNLIWLDSRNYQEVFWGIDNVFKVFRFDYVWGFGNGIPNNQGLRLGIRGLSNLFSDY